MKIQFSKGSIVIRHSIFQLIVLLMSLSSCEKQDRWRNYSEDEKKSLQDSYRVFVGTEFRMNIDLIIYETYKRKQRPIWFSGKVFNYETSPELDSARKYKSNYFDFSKWPEIKIASDYEMLYYFEEGDVLVKKRGNCDLINASKDNKSISLFFPYRHP